MAPTGGARPDLPMRTVVPVLALVVPAGVFGVLAIRVLSGESIAWDAGTYRFIGSAVQRVGVPLGAQSLLTYGALAGAAAAGLSALALVRRRRVRELAFLVGAVGGMLALDPVLKALFQRPPVSPDGTGYTFPSGTAMVSLAFAGAVVLLLPARAPRLLAIVTGGTLALALGVAVVYLRWHYASDVVGGWCLAVGWLSLLWLVLGDPAHRATAHGRRRIIRSRPRGGSG
jgi:membrane-associated phospholipid phosphatase